MYFEIVNLQRTAQAMKLLEIYIGDHVASRMAIKRNETKCNSKIDHNNRVKIHSMFYSTQGISKDFFKKIKKYMNMYFSNSFIMVRIDCQNMNFVLY